MRLSIVPGVFLAVSLGTLLHSSRLPDILPLCLTGCLFGIGIGAVWAALLQIDIDKTEGLMRMPGTAFWLVTGLILFGIRYVIEVSLAFNRDLAQELFWASLPYAVTGLGTGLSAGWWGALMTRYFAPARREARTSPLSFPRRRESINTEGAD